MIKKLIITTCFIFVYLPVFAQEYSLNQVDQAPKLKNQCPDDDSGDCFESSVLSYIQRNIEIINLIDSGAGTAYVQFTINLKGKVDKLRSRSNSKALQKEAERLVKRMRFDEPARIDGKPVSISYTVPVKFNQKRYGSYERFFDNELAARDYPGIEEVSRLPVFKSCKTAGPCLKNEIKTRLIEQDYSKKQIRQLKISFIISENAELKMPIVITPNELLQKSVSSILRDLEIIKPAYLEGQPTTIRLVYQFEDI